METNLQHEDLLMKLRAKLNEEQIKLWESPYLLADGAVSQSLTDLAAKYAVELSTDLETIVSALHELQLHSLERSKANTEFKETGYATFRVRATVPGEKVQILSLRRKLDVLGSELITAVAEGAKVVESRIKLIFNGKVIKPTPSLEEQGLKNGAQIMALIMAETPEEVKQEDRMYMEMKQTRDDATLLSECVDNLAEDDEYMKLEDQSGNAIQLPTAEKRSLLVGLALHQRGRTHIKKQEYAQALVLLLEADSLFSSCRSSILQCVDNQAVAQVDVAWCYLRLRALAAAPDAGRRLAAAQRALAAAYGPRRDRLRRIKPGDANERVLFMRLYLLQGIVAYHQNKREEARSLLEKAEVEINALRVDETAVTTLMELGWSEAAARTGLRTAGGDLPQAQEYLASRALARTRTSSQQVEGTCADGSPVSGRLVAALAGMGYGRRTATRALRHSNNHVAEAVRIIQDQPELLGDDSDLSSDDTGTPSSDESLVEPDARLVGELEAMGYPAEEAKVALSRCHNHISGALDMLVGCGKDLTDAKQADPSTSSAAAAKQKHKKHKRDKKLAQQQALARLRATIQGEEDDYLDSSLVDEEQYLVQYKSLL